MRFNGIARDRADGLTGRTGTARQETGTGKRRETTGHKGRNVVAYDSQMVAVAVAV